MAATEPLLIACKQGPTVSVNLQVPAGTKASGLQQLLAAANGVDVSNDVTIKVKTGTTGPSPASRTSANFSRAKTRQWPHTGRLTFRSRRPSRSSRPRDAAATQSSSNALPVGLRVRSLPSERRMYCGGADGVACREARMRDTVEIRLPASVSHRAEIDEHTSIPW